MKILLSGGLGFIGSHTANELIKEGHDLVIVDNLINAKIEVLDRLEALSGQRPTFYEYDLRDEKKIREIFDKEKIEGIIHFAGLKAVGESLLRPLDYYHNNILSTLVLARLCQDYGCQHFIFSSSATVYGDQPSPLREDMPLKKTTNPYGASKAMSERILADLAAAQPGLSISLLRYFNPVGAHPSGLLGEDPLGIPNNLFPLVVRVAQAKEEKLKVFGDDYDTPDGSGLRDYIHVLDLARGHLLALEKAPSGLSVYNLGSGRPYSVLEVVQAFKEVNQVQVPYEIVARRPDDLAVCYADPARAQRELGWQAHLGLEDMVRDSWHYALLEKED